MYYITSNGLTSGTKNIRVLKTNIRGDNMNNYFNNNNINNNINNNMNNLNNQVNNNFVDPKAREALRRAKAEIAEDMHIFNQANDRGSLQSRTVGFIGGSLGGTMTRRLVEMGEQLLVDQYNNKNNN